MQDSNGWWIVVNVECVTWQTSAGRPKYAPLCMLDTRHISHNLMLTKVPEHGKEVETDIGHSFVITPRSTQHLAARGHAQNEWFCTHTSECACALRATIAS